MDPQHLDPRPSGITNRLTRRAALRGMAGAAVIPNVGRSTRATRSGPDVVSPVDGHPRIWLTEADLPRLRSRASDTNPIWRDGLLVLAEEAKADMDAGHVPDDDSGGYDWEEYPVENYAELFAFVSLLHPDEAARQDYAERARSLLMYAIDEAAKGPAEDEPFRDPNFAIFNRSRWWGEGFPLTVDWIYPSLSDEEKATIRTVFLRWADENMNASTTDHNHPEPAGVVNDPELLADPVALRWAGNNYFAAHMRNIGLMALAFDPADDPDGALTGFLNEATGAWLYMVDHVLRADARGGMPTEGFEYSPQQLAYVVQFLLALHTAGQDDPARWGPQVVLTSSPFWDEVIPAYLNSISPSPAIIPDYEYIGPIYQPAWYGDGQNYWAPDVIKLMGALGRYDERTGNTARLDAARWIEINLAPGGPEFSIPARVADIEDHLDAITYFLLFDPDAPDPADPRTDVPPTHFAPGIGRLLARTSWAADATFFTYALGWIMVDHQHCDGNEFEFYRKGEWLTKERTGYGFNIGASDYHNTIALENDPPDHNDEDDYRHIIWERGSQWWGTPDGDPTILAMSTTDDYVYALGDATNLYNSSYEGSTDIMHASRSIVWLKPDHIVIYDRAASKTDDRFKRFWLNLPTEAEIAGNISTATTMSGQQLVVTTLLPTDAAISSEPAEALEENSEPAVGEPMRFRLRVEVPGGPTDVRFLHVLQGVDAGAQADPVSYIDTREGGTIAGALFGETAVLFPVEIGVELGAMSYTVSAPATRHLVTGLQPDGSYDIKTSIDGGNVTVTVRAGSTQQADGGGVLVLDLSGQES